jgi:Spy/CpxP family protein refolding chaperone
MTQAAPGKTKQHYMKAILKYALAAAIALTGMTLVSYAAETTPATPAPGRRQQQTLQERLDQMTKDLKLTAEQKTTVEKLLKKQAEDMAKLRQDTGLSREDRTAKMRPMRVEFTAEMKKILTADQFAQFEKQQQQGQGRRNRPQP